eukprot:1463847-Pleurochrysis_carterae.AAC.1
MSNDKHVARIEANRPSTSCKVSTSSPSEQGETTPEGAKDAAGAVRASQVRSARRSAQRSRAWREYVWVEVAGNRLPRLEAAVEARSCEDTSQAHGQRRLGDRVQRSPRTGSGGERNDGGARGGAYWNPIFHKAERGLIQLHELV